MRNLVDLTPQVRQFELRETCAGNIEDVFTLLDMRTDLLSEQPVRYPLASTWCDAVINHHRSVHGSGSTVRSLKCPAVQEGKSTYAMNPDCKPDSPAEVVLLFETKAGWNQHGGPELFTFDNHDPKGGLVLLNDGTVKFIRTEEELKQLRWK